MPHKNIKIVEEESSQHIAILLLYLCKQIGRRPNRRVVRQSLDKDTDDFRLPKELYERMRSLDPIERKILISGNNNTARSLATWWHKHDTPKSKNDITESERSKRNGLIRSALHKLTIKERAMLSKLTVSELRALCR